MYSDGAEGRIVRRMDEYELVDSFNCGDNFGELNSFIVDDADLYRRELLAVTYLMEDAGIPIAYFSLANDRIGIEDFENSTLYNRFRRKTFVNSKRIKHYPAVKICRLGVSEKLQHLGIGTAIIDYIKLYFLDDNKAGCRYLTVDAHCEAIPFYVKNGFRILCESTLSPNQQTVLMYYDLISLK